MHPQEQRRRYPRIPSENTVLVRKLGPDEVEGFTKTRTVGLGGCMFLSDRTFGEGSYVDLLIAVRHTVIKALAKVVYEHTGRDGAIEIGVEFVQISETDRRLLEVLWETGSQRAEGQV
jgi:c-di-GMP-binding flagellar brake protein YcgR